MLRMTMEMTARKRRDGKELKDRFRFPVYIVCKIHLCMIVVYSTVEKTQFLVIFKK